MRNLFLTPEATADLIATGAVAFISGSEVLLRGLPPGRWIGGTTAYFVTETGGVAREDRLFCTVFDEALRARTAILPASRLEAVTEGRFSHGVTCIIAPAFSEAHQRYALEGPALPGLYDQPVFGWVAGVRLDLAQQQLPKVFDGATGLAACDGLAALWLEFSPHLEADLDIVNLFEEGDGDVICFPEAGFSVGDCLVDGRPTNFAEYLVAGGFDTRSPMVADYGGAVINVSFQAVDRQAGVVRLYAPVVPGVSYRLARPVKEHTLPYAYAAPPDEAPRMLSCNCILNYLHAGLEGRPAGGFVGPVTFGEFAYILLNQTLVRLAIFDPTEDSVVAGRLGASVASYAQAIER